MTQWLHKTCVSSLCCRFAFMVYHGFMVFSFWHGIFWNGSYVQKMFCVTHFSTSLGLRKGTHVRGLDGWAERVSCCGPKRDGCEVARWWIETWLLLPATPISVYHGPLLLCTFWEWLAIYLDHSIVVTNASLGDDSLSEDAKGVINASEMIFQE